MNAIPWHDWQFWTVSIAALVALGLVAWSMRSPT